MTYDEIYNKIKPQLEEKDWHKNKGTFEQLFEVTSRGTPSLQEELDNLQKEVKDLGMKFMMDTNLVYYYKQVKEAMIKGVEDLFRNIEKNNS